MKPSTLLLCGLFSLVLTQLLAHPGIGIVGDSQGNIYFTDLVHVWKIDAEGQITIAVRDVHTHQLLVDDKDNLYGSHSWYEGEATDEWGYYIWKLTPAGRKEYVVPRSKGFPRNSHLVGNPAGYTYWFEGGRGEQKLKKQFKQGASALVCEHNFENIRWLYHHSESGCVFLVDQLSVKKITAAGEVQTLAEDLSHSALIFSFLNDQHKLMGLWTDNIGTLHLAGFAAQKVYKIIGPNKLVTVRKSGGSWGPTGGFFDKNNTLWVLEYSVRNKVRVVQITSAGETTIHKAPES